MAKKNVAYMNGSMSECIEKFATFAAQRKMILDESTYGFYEVRRGNNKTVLGAVRAENANCEEGWIINWANKERKFVADSDKSVFVGKKVSVDECRRRNARKHSKKAVPVLDE